MSDRPASPLSPGRRSISRRTRAGLWIDRNPVLAVSPILALLAALLLATPQFLTGDEPRYLLYAMSVIRHGTLVMPQSEWDRLVAPLIHFRPSGLPSGGSDVVVLNGVYLPVLLSPIAGLFSLPGLRAATLMAGLWGLWCLHGLLRRVGGAYSALATSGLVAFSLPLLPYLHLFYMETFLFALVCWGWGRLQQTERTLRGDLLTAAIIMSIPVVHLRGSGVAALLGLHLVRQMWARGDRRGIVLVSVLAGVAGTGFVCANLWIYGAVTGPVNSARPPTPADWFPVLSMQLFNVHHGLLAYAPVWVAGWAGLLSALRSCTAGDRARLVLRQALLLAVVAAVTGVGVNPGECWPARFWVLSVPMLGVGLSFWLHRMHGVLPAICIGLLVLVTALNTALFVSHPNMFLDDRQTSTTYDALFTRFGHFDANLVLPVETDDPQDVELARNLTLGAAAVALSLALSLRRPVAAAPALVLLLSLLDLAQVRPVPSTEYRVLAAPGVLSVSFNKPLRRPALLLGRSSESWFLPPFRRRFSETASSAGGHMRSVRAANQVIVSTCGRPTRSLLVRSDGPDLADETNTRLIVLESRSFLQRLLPAGPC